MKTCPFCNEEAEMGYTQHNIEYYRCSKGCTRTMRKEVWNTRTPIDIEAVMERFRKEFPEEPMDYQEKENSILIKIESFIKSVLGGGE